MACLRRIPALSVTRGRPTAAPHQTASTAPHTPGPPTPARPYHWGRGGWERQMPDHIYIYIYVPDTFRVYLTMDLYLQY